MVNFIFTLPTSIPKVVENTLEKEKNKNLTTKFHIFRQKYLDWYPKFLTEQKILSKI